MQAHVLFILTVFLCFLLAPSSSEAQENDKWGPWGEWSPCSRTCGVGVSYQERECLEKEKPEDHCKGSNRIYTTCNIQDCPEGSRDFRLEQCEAYNNRTTTDGQKYRWVPYIPSNERCVLNCMPKGEYFFYRWADKVVDGTRCGIDTYDICVDGRCEKLGCDLILNSNAKEDKCRVCNGNGENCKTYKGVNNEDGDGYKEIVVIPASATNINIQELAPTSNFLALADSSGSYFFNGDYTIQNPRKNLIAGTVFNYERSAFGQERIFSLGPTSIPVHVEVLHLGGKNPGISFEFSVPKSITKLPKRAQFSWRTDEFDKCSVTCAGGEQKRRVFCVRDNTGKEVPPSNCDLDKKPSHKQECNPQPCPASWFVSAWSTCSVTCSRGKQIRRVHCQHIVQGGEAEMIPDDQCPDPKPITMRLCQMQRNCPAWSVSQWSKCNVTCGLGFKHRNVTCQSLDAKKILQAESCNLAFKPNEKEQCNPGPCTVTWMASNWSECYPKCGKGMSTRMVYCVSISDRNQKYPDGLCEKSSRPISEKNCSSADLCPPMWHASQWSTCTATCGVGMQMRNVLCAQKERPNMLRILPNDQCNRTKKMNGLQKCSVKPCQAGWYIYPWEPCSKTCGEGVRRRSVKCFADSKEDSEEKWCKAEDKPATEEQCFGKECKVPSTALTTLASTTIAATTTVTTRSPTTTVTTSSPTTTVTTSSPTTTVTASSPTTTVTASSPTTTVTTTTTAGVTTTTTTTEKPTTVTDEATTEKPTTVTDEATTATTTEKPTTVTITEKPTTSTTTKELTTEATVTRDSTTTEVTTEPVEKETTTAEIRTTQETITVAEEEKTTEVATTTKQQERTTTAVAETTTTTAEETTSQPSTTESRIISTSPRATLSSSGTSPPSSSASTTPETTTERPTTARRIKPAKITERPKDTMAYVGAEMIFRCRATGYPIPVITWRKGSVPVSSLDSSRIQILYSGDLRITNVTEHDDDTYTCTATNFFGPMDNAEAHLDVIVPVSASVSPKNLTAYPGDDVKITCTSVGVPEPAVEWYKQRNILITQGRVSVSRTNLMITQVQASDSGKYECVARHNYGLASDWTYLSVVKKEEPTTPPKAKCEDNPAIAHCAVVRRVNYCCINYYQKACCKTCEDILPWCT